MPEFLPAISIENLLLFPIQNCNFDTPEGDVSLNNSLKLPLKNIEDYEIYDATSTGTASIHSTPTNKITPDWFFSLFKIFNK